MKALSSVKLNLNLAIFYRYEPALQQNNALKTGRHFMAEMHARRGAGPGVLGMKWL
jgi:hypothetical protein